MTNIMALIVNEKQENQLPFDGENHLGVVVSDGLGSNQQEKLGGYQKLFPIGDNYLLGTGSLDAFHFIAKKVAKEGAKTPRELAVRVEELTRENITLRTDEPLNLIVVGKDEVIEGYHVLLPRFKEPLPFDGYCIDGSGSTFVQKARERDRERGNSMIATFTPTIADLTMTMYDYANAATKSIGVNGELQFGWLTPEGNATLFHPNTWQVVPAKEYLNGKGEVDPKRQAENTQFYRRLLNNLNSAWQLRGECNSLTSRMTGEPHKREDLAKELIETMTSFDGARRRINEIITGYIAYHNPKS